MTKKKKASAGRRNSGQQKKRSLWITLAVLLAALTGLGVCLALGEQTAPASSSVLLGQKTVVIDAGHGGSDGGTLGVNTSVAEAHINLQIARRLQAVLESSGTNVIMTRQDEAAVGATKDEDMANRRKIIKESGQDVTVSIHQNHYSDPAVKGPQVFYAPGSIKGRQLAECIQARLNGRLEVTAPRQAMEGNYYIVKSGAAPAVIVECGFLSNPEEEQLLQKGAYQIEIVKAITEGLEDYFALQELPAEGE
ncbi:MAG: N-acetylmuramoyl-L-alanine amidase [Christensenellaceae bacterium]|nr:N-acetylmuramoyl-L-alanine amidase [Christensenellaceae bacterium]